MDRWCLVVRDTLKVMLKVEGAGSVWTVGVGVGRACDK